MSKTRNTTPSNFVVLLEIHVDTDEEKQGFTAYRILSEEHEDTAKAKSWLKKNLADIVAEHGEDSMFRIANLQPPIQQKIEMVPKLTLG